MAAHAHQSARWEVFSGIDPAILCGSTHLRVDLAIGRVGAFFVYDHHGLPARPLSPDFRAYIYAALSDDAGPLGSSL